MEVTMLKNSALFLVLAFSVLASFADVYPVSLNHYDLQDPKQVVTAYFHCLKEGDLFTLTNIIGGNLLEEKRNLIEKESNYAIFLRNYYASTRLGSMELKRIERDKIEARLTVFQRNDVVVFALILSETDNLWLITDDITP